jgi:hypothetical protein
VTSYSWVLFVTPYRLVCNMCVRRLSRRRKFWYRGYRTELSSSSSTSALGDGVPRTDLVVGWFGLTSTCGSKRSPCCDVVEYGMCVGDVAR